MPEIIRLKVDRGDGLAAVIYFALGEPETYDPIGWINQFNEFEEQIIHSIPMIARPILIHQLRNAYLKVGQSHHCQMYLHMLKN